jgi:hypothetical protein
VSYTAVVYSPNMSATAHVSRIADPRKAWGVICSLLEACESVSGPSNAQFTAYKATKCYAAAIAARCVAATVERFGKPRIETEGGRRRRTSATSLSTSAAPPSSGGSSHRCRRRFSVGQPRSPEGAGLTASPANAVNS